MELKPDWAKGYSRLGAAHVGLHEYADAVAAYEKGLELDPANEGLKSGLADTKRLQDKDEAGFGFGFGGGPGGGANPFAKAFQVSLRGIAGSPAARFFLTPQNGQNQVWV